MEVQTVPIISKIKHNFYYLLSAELHDDINYSPHITTHMSRNEQNHLEQSKTLEAIKEVSEP